MTKMNVPKLRFKGFSGEWIEERTDKLCHFKKGKGFSKNDLSDRGNPILLYGSLYTNFHSYLSTVETFVQDVNYDVCLSVKGDVVVPSSGETREDIARATNIDSNDIIIGGDLNILHPKEMLNSLFLSLYITYGKGHEKLRQLAQGNSVVHLYNSDLKSLKILHPKIEEQQKIGDFLKKIDKLIELQTKKLEALKKLKQGYLQKMFPQDGDKVPRLRFREFSDDWDKIKLSDILKKGKSGGTPNTKIKRYYNGNIPFLSIKDVSKSNGVISNTEKHISNEGLENSSAWIVPKGSLTISMYASVGSVAKINSDIATSQAFFNMILLDKVSVDFMYQFFSQFNYMGKWNRLIATGTQGNLNATEINNVNIQIPYEYEQKKVGKFFSKIDIIIESQTDNLDKLIKLKKGYLNRLFI